MNIKTESMYKSYKKIAKLRGLGAETSCPIKRESKHKRFKWGR